LISKCACSWSTNIRYGSGGRSTISHREDSGSITSQFMSGLGQKNDTGAVHVRFAAEKWHRYGSCEVCDRKMAPVQVLLRVRRFAPVNNVSHMHYNRLYFNSTLLSEKKGEKSWNRNQMGYVLRIVEYRNWKLMSLFFLKYLRIYFIFHCRK
jgi:hypothetical protein